MFTGTNAYLFLVVFLGVAVIFPLIPIGLARLWAWTFSPPKPGFEKQATYECGLAAPEENWRPLRPGYYRYALLFLVFDVEVLFLLPAAAAVGQLPVGAWVALLGFLALLAEGLAWAWGKRILTWK